MVQNNPWATQPPSPPPATHAPGPADEARRREQGDPDAEAPQPEEDGEPVPVTGPTRPQAGVAPVRALPVRACADTASLFFVGAHGGSGETTVASLDPRWSATDHTWPELPEAARAQCVVVARTHVSGLLAAQRALAQWASSTAGASAECVGLLLIADAPGRPPAPIVDLIQHVSGGAPRVWRLDWLEEWRLGDLDSRPPRAARRLLRQLHALPAATAGGTIPTQGE